MNCSNCNYLLTDESKPCPKCRQMAARYGAPPPPNAGAAPYAGANKPSPEWQQPGSAPGQPPTAPRYVGQPSPGYDPMYPQAQAPQGQAPQAYPPQNHAPQGQAPQGYAPPGYAPPGYGPPPPQQGYHPDPYGMHPQSTMPATPAKSSKRNWIIGGSVAAVLVVLFIIGNMGGNDAPAGANGQNAVAAVSVPTGPTFSEVDTVMDGRTSKWTDAQRDTYWDKVASSQVTWSGEVVDVSVKDGGSLTLKCNPDTETSDTDVDLDGTQMEQLPKINKGQHVTVHATLYSHSMYGYFLTDGQIVN